jgi:hypothetical protein
MEPANIPSNSPGNNATTMNQIQSTANQLWTSMTTKEKDSPSSSQTGDMKATAESVLRVMFGACTTGSSTNISADDDDNDLEDSKNTCEPSSPDIIYPKNFSERQAIAALKQLKEKRLSLEYKKIYSTENTSKIPGLFPMSFPNNENNFRQDVLEDRMIRSRPDESFDDGISAISNHTLEDMALTYEAKDGFPRIRSDLTQDPKLTQEEAWKQTVKHRRGHSTSLSSPLTLRRDGRSTNTKYSTHSKSTVSTATQDFAFAFRKDEQDYWNEIVKEQEIVKPKDFLTIARDGTLTTVPSSSCSGANTTPRNFRSKSTTDPDQLMDVLVMPPGTEMVEI